MLSRALDWLILAECVRISIYFTNSRIYCSHSNMLPTPDEIRQRYGAVRPQSAKPQFRKALPPLPETISESDARRILRQTSSLAGGQLDRVIRQATVGEDVVSVDRLKEQFEGEKSSKSV